MRAVAVVIPVAAVAAAWASYLPLGAKYASVLALALLCGVALRTSTGTSTSIHTRTPTRALLRPAAALLAWLALSLAWTPAPWPLALSQLGQYGLLLLLLPIAAGCPPAAAQRALRHFVLASALAAVLVVLHAQALLPDWPRLWQTTAAAEGNQRIAVSVLLALATVISVWQAAQAAGRGRSAWLLAAAACLAGLALQDRRTGMLLLLLLAAAALARAPLRRRWRLALALLGVLAATAAWQGAEGVRGRFAEGVAELQHYRSDDGVATSWGQRLRMWELTAAMVAERPLAGHGIGSWSVLWRQRVTPGTALAQNSTPHSEPLALAQQGGLVAVGLWLWLLGSALRAAWRAGPAGLPALCCWLALAWTALFNAAHRDAKFALPLLALALLALAAARDPEPRATALRAQTPG